MSIFNDIGKKISKTSQSIVNKASQITDISKINGKISEEEKGIKNLYQQLGEAYYERYSSQENEFSALCNSISESKERIDSLRVQLNQAKNIKKCANCGAECEMNTLFCSACGTAFPVEQKQVKICESCGNACEMESAFCVACGKPFAEASATPKRYCTNCGFELDADAVFCPECGTKNEVE